MADRSAEKLCDAVGLLSSSALDARTDAAALVRTRLIEAAPHLVRVVLAPGERDAGRALALRLLGELPRPAREIQDLAVEMLGERSTLISGEAQDVLERNEAWALEALIRGLGRGKPVGRRRSARLLARFANHALPRFLGLLAHRQPGVREGAAWILAEFDGIDSHAQAVLPALATALEDPDDRVRAAAAGAIPHLGQAALAGLLPLLRHEQPGTRRSAAAALGNIGEPAVAPMASLLHACADDAQTAILILSTLAEMQPPGEHAVLVLASAVRHANPDVGYAAVRSLERIGGVEIKPAVPALVDAFQDPRPEVRYAAESALLDIGPAVAPRLVRVLEREPGELVRVHSIRVLKRMREDARCAIPVLEKALSDPSEEVRAVAQRALEALRPRVRDPNPK